MKTLVLQVLWMVPCIMSEFLFTLSRLARSYHLHNAFWHGAFCSLPEISIHHLKLRTCCSPSGLTVPTLPEHPVGLSLCLSITISAIHRPNFAFAIRKLSPPSEVCVYRLKSVHRLNSVHRPTYVHRPKFVFTVENLCLRSELNVHRPKFLFTVRNFCSPSELYGHYRKSLFTIVNLFSPFEISVHRPISCSPSDRSLSTPIPDFAPSYFFRPNPVFTTVFRFTSPLLLNVSFLLKQKGNVSRGVYTLW